MYYFYKTYGYLRIAFSFSHLENKIKKNMDE